MAWDVVQQNFWSSVHLGCLQLVSGPWLDSLTLQILMYTCEGSEGQDYKGEVEDEVGPKH